MRLLTLALLFLSQLAFSQTEKLDSLFTAMVSSERIAGCGIAIFDKDEVHYMKAFGFANIESQKPYTTATIQNIASVSKTLAGVSLMKAQELGLLDLDDEISKHLPFELKNPHYPTEKITLRHLANHTASIRDRGIIYELKSYYYKGDNPIDMETFVTNYYSPKGKWYKKKNFLKAKPGSQYRYSNIGAALAGYVIERVSGMPYHEFTKKHIFEPVGMNNSGWFLSQVDVENHAIPYKGKKSGLKPKKLYGLATYPDGGLRTSVKELTAYAQAILNDGGPILSKGSVEEMLASGLDEGVEAGDIEDQGIFWKHDIMGKKQTVGHTGGDPGVTTLMVFEPETGLGYITFFNTEISQTSVKQVVEAWKTMFQIGSTLSN